MLRTLCDFSVFCVKKFSSEIKKRANSLNRKQCPTNRKKNIENLQGIEENRRKKRHSDIHLRTTEATTMINGVSWLLEVLLAVKTLCKVPLGENKLKYGVFL